MSKSLKDNLILYRKQWGNERKDIFRSQRDKEKFVSYLESALEAATASPVEIGSDVFVGANSAILKGVKISR